METGFERCLVSIQPEVYFENVTNIDIGRVSRHFKISYRSTRLRIFQGLPPTSRDNLLTLDDVGDPIKRASTIKTISSISRSVQLLAQLRVTEFQIGGKLVECKVLSHRSISF